MWRLHFFLDYIVLFCHCLGLCLCAPAATLISRKRFRSWFWIQWRQTPFPQFKWMEDITTSRSFHSGLILCTAPMERSAVTCWRRQCTCFAPPCTFCQCSGQSDGLNTSRTFNKYIRQTVESQHVQYVCDDTRFIGDRKTSSNVSGVSASANCLSNSSCVRGHWWLDIQFT